jgi:hypothetical protein
MNTIQLRTEVNKVRTETETNGNSKERIGNILSELERRSNISDFSMTEAQIIGYWVNGKPIWRAVISITDGTAGSVNINHNLLI